MVLFENSHVIDKDEANDGQRCGERKLGGDYGIYVIEDIVLLFQL